MLYKLGPVFLTRSSLFLLLLLLASSNIAAQTLDAPHDIVGCRACHDMAAYDQPNLIPGDSFAPDPGNKDWRLYNTVCWWCHTAGDPLPGIQTHSSGQTGDTDNEWTVECCVCHNQHQQEQDRANGSAYGKFIRSRIDKFAKT